LKNKRKEIEEAKNKQILKINKNSVNLINLNDEVNKPTNYITCQLLQQNSAFSQPPRNIVSKGSKLNYEGDNEYTNRNMSIDYHDDNNKNRVILDELKQFFPSNIDRSKIDNVLSFSQMICYVKNKEWEKVLEEKPYLKHVQYFRGITI